MNKVNKLILGPLFVPQKWFKFPNKNIWREKNFPEILKKVKGIVVHNDRVKNYLADRSNTTNMYKKYINIRPCTNIKPKNINSFNDRKIDIIFFEKYADLNFREQGKVLLNLLKNSSKRIEHLIYGNYSREYMNILANNSKFIIYFSFYDTGAIGLTEFQNYGVIIFTHQKEFIFDNKSSFYVPELADKQNIIIAYEVIMKKIKEITDKKPNTVLIAKRNYEVNKCQNALDDLCKNIS